jgi:microcystin degradation protein MlrC
MKFVVSMLSHETNMFSPVKTELRHFKERELFYGEEMFTALKGTKTSIGGFIDAAKAHNIELAPTVAASAMPSGLVTADAYRTLKEKILDGTKAAGTVDGVVAALHGSMAVEGIGI